MAVRNLDEAAARLWEEHGLASVLGGRHPAWGTANRVVPLGNDYVELLSVEERRAAESTSLGRALIEATAGGDRWFVVCLADADIDSTAERLGLDVVPGSRTLPDGSRVAWRSAGLDDARREAWMPFFIEWDVPPEGHPGRTPATHRIPVAGITRVDVVGDRRRLMEWLGGTEVPIRIAGGESPGVRAVAVAGVDGGEVLLQ